MAATNPAGSPPPTATSLQLLRRARLGDHAAIDLLIRRHLPRLKRWAHARLPANARHLANTDDLIQDTLLKTIRNVASFEPDREGAFQAYLRQAVLNRIRDLVRRTATGPKFVDLVDDARARDASPLEELLGAEALERYEVSLSRLRPEDREAIVARLELGGTYAEVAVALGKPTANAARVAVSRAVVRLAEEMARAR